MHLNHSSTECKWLNRNLDNLQQEAAVARKLFVFDKQRKYHEKFDLEWDSTVYFCF